jgi:hypothetical protein
VTVHFNFDKEREKVPYITMLKEQNVPDPLAPIELHHIVPNSLLEGELMAPFQVGHRFALDNPKHNSQPMPGICLSTPVTKIEITEEANKIRIITCNSIYLVTFDLQSKEQVLN